MVHKFYDISGIHFNLVISFINTANPIPEGQDGMTVQKGKKFKCIRVKWKLLHASLTNEQEVTNIKRKLCGA